MKSAKKYLIYPKAKLPIFLLIASFLTITPLNVADALTFPNEAPEISGNYNTPEAYAQDKSYTLQTIVKILGEIRNFILIAGIIFIIIMIVWAGISYVAAGGDEGMEEAKSRLITALIGAAIILAVFVLLTTISSVIENQSLVDRG